jgi:hypothetical protein
MQELGACCKLDPCRDYKGESTLRLFSGQRARFLTLRKARPEMPSVLNASAKVR